MRNGTSGRSRADIGGGLKGGGVNDENEFGRVKGECSRDGPARGRFGDVNLPTADDEMVCLIIVSRCSRAIEGELFEVQDETSIT